MEQSQLLSATLSLSTALSIHRKHGTTTSSYIQILQFSPPVRQWLSGPRLRNPEDRFILSGVVLLPTPVAEGRQNILTKSPFKMAQNVEVSFPRVKSEHCSLQMRKILGLKNHSCLLQNPLEYLFVTLTKADNYL